MKYELLRLKSVKDVWRGVKRFHVFNWFLMFFYAWRITTNDIHVILRKWLENCLKNLWKEDVIILCHRPEIRTKKEETKWCLKPTIVINNDKSSSLSLGEISLLQLLVRWCLCTRYSDSNDYLRFSCDQTLSSSDYFEETYVHTFNRNWLK